MFSAVLPRRASRFDGVVRGIAGRSRNLERPLPRTLAEIFLEARADSPQQPIKRREGSFYRFRLTGSLLQLDALHGLFAGGDRHRERRDLARLRVADLDAVLPGRELVALQR